MTLARRVVWLCSLLLLCAATPGHSQEQTYSVTLAWDKVVFDDFINLGLGTGYRVYYTSAPLGGPPYTLAGPVEGDPADPQYTVSGLEKYKVYHLSVTAYVVTPTNYYYESHYSGEAVFNDDDGDAMPDDWEVLHNVDDATADPDLDGFSNLKEYLNGTDPNVDNTTLPDADQDGMPDIWELANGLDPNNYNAAADPDGDGLANIAEYFNGTHPNAVTARDTHIFK